MERNINQNNPEFSENKEIKEQIISVFEKLSKKIDGKNLSFKDEHNKDKFLVMPNKAGNLSIDDYENDTTYLVWSDGEASVSSLSDPEKLLDAEKTEAIAQKLIQIVEKIENLKSEELKIPEFK